MIDTRVTNYTETKTAAFGFGSQYFIIKNLPLDTNPEVYPALAREVAIGAKRFPARLVFPFQGCLLFRKEQGPLEYGQVVRLTYRAI